MSDEERLEYHVINTQRRIRTIKFMFQKFGPVLFSRKNGLPSKFGTMTFGSEHLEKKYLVLSDTSSVGLLTTFILRYWAMARPEVVISLSGGAQDFKLSPHVQELLDNGIAEVTSSARAMFFTPGSNAGVCKMVAGILHRAGLNGSIVGVIALACIKENERLVAQSKPGTANKVVEAAHLPHLCGLGGTPSPTPRLPWLPSRP
jgi:hypothetical protein